MKHGVDLPRAVPDERLLRQHHLSAIYPSAETLEMFEIDKVAIVSAFSAFPLVAEGRTCGRYCWEEKKKKNSQTTLFTTNTDRPARL